MEILEVIQEVKHGRIASYKNIVLFYQKPLIRYLIGFGIRKEVVEEIAQDVFSQAYFKLNSFDSEKAHFTTWLFTIAKNRAFTEIKKSNYNVKEYSEKTEISMSGFRQDSETPFQSIDNLERSLKIQNLIQKLPLQFRNAVTLFFINEMNLNDIAVIEKCSLGTVKSRIFRGKEMLKSKMGEFFYE